MKSAAMPNEAIGAFQSTLLFAFAGVLYAAG